MLWQLNNIGQTTSTYLLILNINLRFVADEVLVDIPAGIEDGQTVRLRIDGEQEVLVQVRVEDGGNLRREGYHVHSDLWIDIWDAAFGKTVTIPGLHGNINIKIPKEIKYTFITFYSEIS